MEFSTTRSSVAPVSGFDLTIFTIKSKADRESRFPKASPITADLSWSRTEWRSVAAFVLLMGITASLAPTAQGQFGFHKSAPPPSPTPASTDSGLPTRVVYHDQKYLVTAGPGGMTYSVAIEGNPALIGIVIKAPNAPVKYQAFDNTLETAATVKGVFAAFLNPPSTSGATTGGDSTVVTSFDTAKKQATVQTSLGTIRFSNGVNDFTFVDGGQTVEGHFSDGSNAAQKTSHLLKSTLKSVSTFGVASEQVYAGSVLELRMNKGPKAAFGLDGKAKDMGPEGAANAAGIKFALQSKAGLLADAAAKAATAQGVEKPAYLPLFEAWKNSIANPGGTQ